jgi:preprotein translocase subunit YajC
MRDDEDEIKPGDRVSWKSNITNRRHFGTVTEVGETQYVIRTDSRMILKLARKRVTKECG